MTGIVALNVVIGLVFIYLLYSLLTSLAAEIIATNLGLRARNLHSALTRMLNDEKVSALLKDKDMSGIVEKIYEHPEIKSLAPNRIFSKPSNIPADSFARALVDTLKNGKAQEELDDLKEGIKSYQLPKPVESYLLGIAEEVEDDVTKFSKIASSWFDNTMNNATEWYKRNMQIVLFIIGFIIAWMFNVNTISIVEKLSVDKEARNHLVQLASSYIENRNDQARIDTAKKINSETDSLYNAKLSSLIDVKDDILVDIASSQSVIGGGTWLPDTLYLNKNGELPQYIQANILPKKEFKELKQQGFLTFDITDQVVYALNMLVLNFVGYFITAIALSLGAPFWFDILNKLMKMKTAVTPKAKD